MHLFLTYQEVSSSIYPLVLSFSLKICKNTYEEKLIKKEILLGFHPKQPRVGSRK